MNILILNWKDIKNPDVGGAEIILYELAKRMVRDGHTVTWFCRSFAGATAGDNIDGISVIRRGNRFTVYWQAFLYYRSLKKKPDKVIDCVNTICWQTPLYVPQEKRVAYVNQLAREVFFYELPPLIAHISYVFEPLEYLSYKTTRFLCYSGSVKEDLVSFGIPKRNIDTFPIGIDHYRYNPGKKSKDPLFIFVARLTRMKRPDLCIEAIRLVIQKYPKVRLAIVGYGPMERTLESMINAYGLEQNVALVNNNHLFFDKHPKDQKVKLMQEAWALILPSVKEGWGMVVTEAAACGTTTIGTNVTGLRDSIRDGKTGVLLARVPTASDLTNAIIRIIEHKKYRLTLEREAKAYSNQFTWEASATVFMRLLKRL